MQAFATRSLLILIIFTSQIIRHLIQSHIFHGSKKATACKMYKTTFPFEWSFMVKINEHHVYCIVDTAAGIKLYAHSLSVVGEGREFIKL